MSCWTDQESSLQKHWAEWILKPFCLSYMPTTLDEDIKASTVKTHWHYACINCSQRYENLQNYCKTSKIHQLWPSTRTRETREAATITRTFHFYQVQENTWQRSSSDTWVSNIIDNILPESQCGFQSGHSTVDMIFSLRLLQEKYVEQQQSLCITFADLSKAFDTVGRDALWKLLPKFAYQHHPSVSWRHERPRQHMWWAVRIISHLEDIQITSHFVSAAKDFRLTISLKKTEVLYQPTPGSCYEEHTVLINDICLNPNTKLCYLGSIMSSAASLDIEVESRTRIASFAFGQLKDCIWS